MHQLLQMEDSQSSKYIATAPRCTCAMKGIDFSLPWGKWKSSYFRESTSDMGGGGWFVLNNTF